MDPQSKSIFTSVTFWGILCSVVSQLASRYGWNIDGAGLANDLVSLASAGVALYGRYRASQPVHVLPVSGPTNQGGYARVGLLFPLALIVLTSLFGCATTPQTPAQSVYAAQVTYAAALTIAVQYKELPACGQPASPRLCADADIVARLQQADDVAFETLQAAQTVVRVPGAGLNVHTAVAAAVQAVGLFMNITQSLGLK